jgi:hypothetical protein
MNELQILMENPTGADIRSRLNRTFISTPAFALEVIIMPVIGGIASGSLNDYPGRTIWEFSNLWKACAVL